MISRARDQAGPQPSWAGLASGDGGARAAGAALLLSRSLAGASRGSDGGVSHHQIGASDRVSPAEGGLSRARPTAHSAATA